MSTIPTHIYQKKVWKYITWNRLVCWIYERHNIDEQYIPYSVYWSCENEENVGKIP